MVHVVFFKRTEIREPFYDHHPERSTTENWKWRKGLFIVFTDTQGRELWYMPKWSEIREIIQQRDETERINKDLCRRHGESGK